MNNASNKIYFLIGALGPIFYWIIVTILGFIWGGYDFTKQSMSEIGSVVSPYKDIMNFVGFSLLGVSIIIFGIGILKEFGKGILQYFSFVMLAIAGIFMFAVGFFPCDAGCVDVTWIGKMHSFTSTVPSIALPLAAMAMATVFAKQWSRKWGYFSFWLGLFSMSAGPLMFVPEINQYFGLVQRFGIGLSLIWMIILSLKIIEKI